MGIISEPGMWIVGKCREWFTHGDEVVRMVHRLFTHGYLMDDDVLDVGHHC